MAASRFFQSTIMPQRTEVQYFRQRVTWPLPCHQTLPFSVGRPSIYCFCGPQATHFCRGQRGRALVCPPAMPTVLHIWIHDRLAACCWKNNHVPDCLSRAVVEVVHLGLDYNDMPVAQVNDPEVQSLKTCATGMQIETPHSYVTFPQAILNQLSPHNGDSRFLCSP